MRAAPALALLVILFAVPASGQDAPVEQPPLLFLPVPEAEAPELLLPDLPPPELGNDPPALLPEDAGTGLLEPGLPPPTIEDKPQLPGTLGVEPAVMTAPAAPSLRDAGDDGIVTIAVFGDSLAEGLWGGLYRKLVRDERFEILRRAQHSTGLSRSDYFDWSTALDQFLAEDPIDAAVVSVGLNDLQAIYLDGQNYVPFNGSDWDRTYAERVAQLMRRLHDAQIPTFWIGLPIMRSESYAASIAHLNAIYEANASAIGVTFVPLWELTADEEGKYSSYLQDAEGRSRLMRANDGIHFTTRGYDLLAEHLYQVLTTAVPIPQEAATP